VLTSSSHAEFWLDEDEGAKGPSVWRKVKCDFKTSTKPLYFQKVISSQEYQAAGKLAEHHTFAASGPRDHRLFAPLFGLVGFPKDRQKQLEEHCILQHRRKRLQTDPIHLPSPRSLLGAAYSSEHFQTDRQTPEFLR
jgi:hypothetical protein